MVLEELGSRIAGALANLSNTSVIDETVLNDCLKEIATALLQADVNVKHVAKLREEVKKKVKIDDVAAGLNKRKIIESAVFEGLCGMLDAGNSTGAAGDKAAGKKTTSTGGYELKKGRPNIVMFVGLQGAGKTTTCTKYAYHYKKKGFKPALVCADTFRAGAFDQLKQNATKASVPYYGSYSETDPAVIAQQGVEKFRESGMDLIIVDTSGRHKQQEALFEEMRQVAAAVNPDAVIFVMDGSIGQAAFDQAKAFKDAVEVGQVIITKLDGHAKGGGALSAVSATQSPITFIGTGEHMDEFQQFDTKAFVSRLLGKGDLKQLRQTIESVIPEKEDKEELMETLAKGHFTLRILYEQLQNIMKMGPVSSVMSMIPGFSNLSMGKGQEQESQARLKRFLTMMDSMTDAELDTNNIKMLQEQSRIVRVAKGSGTSPAHVIELLEEFKRLKAVVSGMGGKGGVKGMPRSLKGMNPHNMQMNMAQMSRMLPPQLLKQMGGPQALQNIMKAMDGKM